MELRLGEKQTLVIVKKVEFGVYLATKEAPEDGEAGAGRSKGRR